MLDAAENETGFANRELRMGVGLSQERLCRANWACDDRRTPSENNPSDKRPYDQY
jgi:hypothetical protein